MADRPVGLGAMRLSTVADRDDARGLAVLVAAIDAGVTLIDTADAYGLDAEDAGHNERLIAAARAARPDAPLIVVTKGGLVRPGGAWIPDARAGQLAAAAIASRDRLGGAPIDLYLLHAIDPRVALSTSVRALAMIRNQGVATRIGVSNVDRTRLEQALAITRIDAVSVELSPLRTAALDGGVIDLCTERGILVLAHRPLGGVTGVRRLARHPAIAAIMAAHGLSAVAATIAWLRALSPMIVPVPGVTSIAHVADLDPPAISIDRPQVAVHAAGAITDPDAEVVLVVGPPGAGKTTLARELTDAGYYRLNRDERGGTLARLADLLDGALAGGERRVVLDNTYPTRATRAQVIAAAARHGVGVRCVELATSIEDAQRNAVTRLLDRYGRLPEPDELPDLARRDANTFGPGAQFRWRRQYEPPAADEGFTSVEHRAFVRAPAGGTHRAVIAELDDVIWAGRPTTVDAIRLVDGAADALAAWHDRGYLIVATAWMPDAPDPAALIDAIRARLPLLAGVARCTHPAGPPVCWCRKPLPGMGLLLARTHDLDLAASIHLGRGPADRTFAARLGLAFEDAA